MYFPKGFNAELSIELGELARQAYAQFEAFEKEESWKLQGKYSLVREFHYVWSPERSIEKGIRNFDITVRRFSRSLRNKSLQIPIGFVVQDKESLYLILRGTQTVKEWVRNFSISLSPYHLANYGKVHEGFLQTYKSIREEIIETIKAANQKQDLFVAGHSLGAALATLAVPDIESTTKRKVKALYTYGSPRVGDDSFVKAFNTAFGQRSFRIANTSDIITSIPLPAPLAGRFGGYFSHVETPVDLTVQEDDLEKNHDMKTYLSKLKESKKKKGIIEQIFVRGV